MPPFGPGAAGLPARGDGPRYGPPQVLRGAGDRAGDRGAPWRPLLTSPRSVVLVLVLEGLASVSSPRVATAPSTKLSSWPLQSLRGLCPALGWIAPPPCRSNRPRAIASPRPRARKPPEPQLPQRQDR